MNKKVQKQSKITNNLNKFLGRKDQEQQRVVSKLQLKSEGKKKNLLNNNNLINNQQDQKTSSIVSKTMTLQSHIKQSQMHQIVVKCPKINELVSYLSLKSALTEEIIMNLTKKCLQSKIGSLWSSSYAPKQVTQLFNIEAANRIKQWINTFFEYKNKGTQEDSSINYIQLEKNNKGSFRHFENNSWELLALIVRGRPGVGKTSAIKAVVKEMNVDIQQCGSDYHQSKYLKEKFQSTQSQSVKTAYNKKVKIQKNSQMITKFLPTVEKQKPKQNKKAQIIHNVSMIFPESDAQKFYSQLSRCISLSKIPFILTNSGQKLPKECQRYDIIQFESGSSEKIHRILWTIYHLESFMILDNKFKNVQKDVMFQQINSQIQTLKLKQLCSLDKIKSICELYNYRLDYIFTFLQHYKQQLNTINLNNYMVHKFRSINEDQLLEQIQFIDFNKMTNFNSQTNNFEIFQDNTQESTQGDKNKQQKQLSLNQYSHKLSLLTVEDTIGQYQQTPHSKYQFQLQQWDNNPQRCIKNQVHRGIKASLAHMVNKEISYSFERLKSTIKASQLCYLPMLIRQKRVNRNSRLSIDTLKKIYDDNQFCYLQQFGHFIKPQ